MKIGEKISVDGRRIEEIFLTMTKDKIKKLTYEVAREGYLKFIADNVKEEVSSVRNKIIEQINTLRPMIFEAEEKLDNLFSKFNDRLTVLRSNELFDKMEKLEENITKFENRLSRVEQQTEEKLLEKMLKQLRGETLK
jgi:hypothetical protein